MPVHSGKTPTNPVRVLVVDDSAFMRTALARIIESDQSLRVAGTAKDGAEALKQVESLRPDVITLDVTMPGIDGLTVLGQIMHQYPTPVIMVSALTQDGASATLEALEMGAFDCIAKPSGAELVEVAQIREELIAKIKAASESPLPILRESPRREWSPAASSPGKHPALSPRVVAIGASTGGPKALQWLLSALPGDFPVGILVVQHMPKGFTGPFAERLDALCHMRVREAEEGSVVEPGVVLLAPADWHMTAIKQSAGRHAIHLSKLPEHMPHRPSVDVLMISVAQIYGSLAMGVILTGMGDDGARGMKAIFDHGGYTIGQDEASCVVYGMPRACAEAGALHCQTSLDAIVEEICRATMFAHRIS